MSTKEELILKLLPNISKTYKNIGDTVGCTKQYVSQIATKHGLSRRAIKVKSSKVKRQVFTGQGALIKENVIFLEEEDPQFDVNPHEIHFGIRFWSFVAKNEKIPNYWKMSIKDIKVALCQKWRYLF